MSLWLCKVIYRSSELHYATLCLHYVDKVKNGSLHFKSTLGNESITRRVKVWRGKRCQCHRKSDTKHVNASYKHDH